MTKTINLTVKIRLELATPVDRSYFYDNLSTTLRSGLGDQLSVDANAVQVVGCEDPQEVLSYATDLSLLLDPNQEIAIIWSVDDVLQVCPNLTRVQALAVLQSAMDNHDAGVGIDWNTLEFIASDLFDYQDE